MATYATIEDFTNYTSGPVPATDVQTETLLRKAEKDIDTVIIPVQSVSDEFQGITLSGVASGNFQLRYIWNRVEYTSDVVNWNDTGAEVVTALQAAVDQYNNPIAPGVWMLPIDSFYLHPWAAGPLPDTPIVVQSTNNMGGQPVEVMTVVNDTLNGPNPTITITEIVRGGLKINPYLLSGDDSYVLKQATCAQAEYRMAMGESFFIRAQWQNVTGPEFRTQGRLPRIGPKVKSELTGSDLLQRGARARLSTVKGLATAYMPVGGTPIPDDWRAI